MKNSQVENIQNDVDLIKSYLSGDENSLKLLIGRYLKPLYNFVFQYVHDQHDVEDIIQDAFVKIWKNLEKFDPEKSFKTWIFSIAKNTALDFLKKKKTFDFSSFEDDQGKNVLLDRLHDDSPLPGEALKHADRAKAINKAMQTLAIPYRTVLFLYYKEGFNFREIAEILRESIDTVKSRHRRALVMLKKVLKL